MMKLRVIGTVAAVLLFVLATPRRVLTEGPAANPGAHSPGYAPEVHHELGGGFSDAPEGGAWNASDAPLHSVLRADQNLPLTADVILVISRDGSLFTDVQVSGTEPPIAGEQPGVDIKAPNGTVYRERYTIRNTDTSSLSIAMGVGRAIDRDPALRTALLGYIVPPSARTPTDNFGYRLYQTPVANQSFHADGVGHTAFDLPFGWSISGVGSAHTHVSIPALIADGGPTLALQRSIPGRAPVADDKGPQIIFQGAFGSADAYNQIGAISTTYDTGNAVTLGFNTAQGGGSAQRMALGLGLRIGSPAGGDCGTGCLNAATAVKINNVSLNRASGNGATLTASPPDPPGITSTAGRMNGIGTTCAITPAYSSRIYMQISGDILNTLQSGGGFAQLRYGMGAAPVNGASPAGISLGTGVHLTHATAAQQVPFSVAGIATGLRPGTAYWLDLAVGTQQGGVAQTVNLTCIAYEI
jgi:hypothetical protein